MPEFRAFHNSELRALSGHRLRGYAAVFNSLSEPLEGGRFRETIRPGAFRNSLSKGEDVRALVNHDPNLIIGRSTAGTLQLEEDNRGLLANISLPDTSYGRDLWESVRRSDLTGMSFGFQTIKDATCPLLWFT